MANIILGNTTADLTGKTVVTTAGAQTITGALTLSGANVVTVTAGSAAAPSIHFATDTITGFYLSAASTIGFAAAGVSIATLVGAQTGGNGPAFSIPSGAYGNAAGTTGPMIGVGRNTSGSTAPGHVALADKSGAVWYLWVDTTGDLRIANAAVQADGAPSDTSGTVVGTQS